MTRQWKWNRRGTRRRRKERKGEGYLGIGIALGSPIDKRVKHKGLKESEKRFSRLAEDFESRLGRCQEASVTNSAGT